MEQAKTRHLAFALLLLAFLVGIIWVLKLSLFRSADNEIRTLCPGNERNIAQSVICYQAAYGHFPPAYVVDKDDRPLYSWRVLILEFLLDNFDYEAFHKKFNYSEPWNSTHNREVLDSMKMPKVFSCPAATKQNETNYVMISGPGTLSDGPHSVSQWDISDGSDKTLLLVETCDSGIHWAEPRDLNFKNVLEHFKRFDIPGIQSQHYGDGAFVSFCDGHQYWLRDDIDPKVLKALITIAGGEEIKDGDY
jgi:hypothetical protein